MSTTSPVQERIAVTGDGGVQLSARVWGHPGNGPTIVLVHGFPDSSAVWIPVAEALVDHGAHVVAHDVRGAGHSEAPAVLAGYDLALLLGDLVAVIDAVSPDRPVHLVGHDWGSIQGWEAACSERLDGRLLSYTSISGPPLDEAGRWARARLGERSVGALARQAMRSLYIPIFHIPGVQAGVSKLHKRLPGAAWGRSIARREGARVDAEWPGPTFGADVARGMQLYRANAFQRLRNPRPQRARVPVQLIVAVRDPWVPPSLLVGIDDMAPNLRRRHVDAGHWVVRSQPVDVAVWISEFIESLEQGAT